MRMSFRVIVVGGLIVFAAVVTVVVFIPDLIWRPAPNTIAHVYTAEQERGRIVFYSNGCNYCHTQYVRAEDTAMGPVSEGGSYVYDNPMILGSERTGPDLSYVGHKRSEEWEIEHLKDPRSLSPLSIMPSFEFLPESDLTALASYLFALGDRVAQERMIPPPTPYVGLSDPTTPVTLQPVSGDTPQGWAAWNAAELQEGKEIYVSYCLTCHGCAGNGLGSYAGTLAVTPADFMQSPFREMPDDQWFWHVSEGVPGTVMPTWKVSLTEDQRWKVIEYIQEIFARPVMRDPDEGDPVGDYANLTNPLSTSAANVDEGKTIFIRECMVCHGDAGRGNGPYATGLQPSPPDFGDGSYGTLADPSYTDADYYWRISEGLPWSAMPSWKLQYDETDRWKLVEFIRVNFTQTLNRPVNDPLLVQPPETYTRQEMPTTASFERGKQLFLTTCSHCHGLAGDGSGWEGAYLNPPPFDFRTTPKDPSERKTVGEYLATVTFGVPGTAMPPWGEFLTEARVWDAIKYVLEAFVFGRPTDKSSDLGTISADYITVSPGNWTDEGYDISTERGAELYVGHCSLCHGDGGAGDGPGTIGNASGSPASFQQGMDLPYTLWRMRDGVPETTMAPFQWLLSDSEIWDVATYVQSLSTVVGGGS